MKSEATFSAVGTYYFAQILSNDIVLLQQLKVTYYVCKKSVYILGLPYNELKIANLKKLVNINFKIIQATQKSQYFKYLKSFFLFNCIELRLMNTVATFYFIFNLKIYFPLVLTEFIKNEQSLSYLNNNIILYSYLTCDISLICTTFYPSYPLNRPFAP